LRMKNTVRFTQYADAIAAAMAGQGVAIGRFPLLAQLLQDKQLVAPFGGRAVSQRGYYVVPSTRGLRNPDAEDFMRWLRAEADVAQLI
jgi:LysR family glycine cleavage system transcriptional activator